MKKTVQAEEFKAKCLQMMDEVQNTHVHFVITKGNEPVAEMIPVVTKKQSYFGWMKGTIEITGDIIAPIDEKILDYGQSQPYNVHNPTKRY